MENISTENTDLVEVRELNDEELASVCGGLKVHLPGVLPNFAELPAEVPGVGVSVPPVLE